MSECDRESSTVKMVWPTGGLLRHGKKSQVEVNSINNYGFFFSVLSSAGGGIVITCPCPPPPPPPPKEIAML